MNTDRGISGMKKHTQQWYRLHVTLFLLLVTNIIIRPSLAEDVEFDDDAYYEGDDGDDYEEPEVDDFYIVEHDDYVSNTYEHTLAKIYVSSIMDIVLCLLCTFFWVLWLVGTIFPNRIQDLYKSDGIVVRGDVLESYGVNAETADDGTFDGIDYPTYGAIVSYIVPARVARSKQGILVTQERNRTLARSPSIEMLRTLTDKVIYDLGPSTTFPLKTSVSNNKVSTNYARSQTPPRPPRSSKQENNTEFQNPNRFPPTKDKSLFDAYTRSFDSCTAGTDNLVSPANVSAGRDSRTKQVETYYKYDNKHVHYYCDGEDDEKEDAFEEDAEQIGSFATLFRIPKMSTPIKTKQTSSLGPVRVKKRFETTELLATGMKNVEIIIVPGNPGSGVLKKEFESEQVLNDSGYFSTSKDTSDDDGMQDEDKDGFQFGDNLSAGIIGIVLAAVSTIGAVHSALALPYKEKVYGWLILVCSMSLMWPTAMLMYKTVNRIRIIAMNKIISFERCGEKTALYGLSKLPNAKLASCSVSGNNSEYGGDGASYVIMLDNENGVERKGVFPQDGDSDVSSLSEAPLKVT